MKQGLTKDDSSRIGFVMSCLFTRALSLDEMKQWAICVYEENESPPLYFIDLLEFKPPLSNIFKIIGFVPHWPYGEEARQALYGIAYMRGRQSIDCPISSDEALEIMRQYPQVEERFRKEFPFINL